MPRITTQLARSPTILSPPQQIDHPPMFTTVPSKPRLALAGFTYVTAAYLGYNYLKEEREKEATTTTQIDNAATKPSSSSCSCCTPNFSSIAQTYDNDIGMDETMMYIPLLRRYLISPPTSWPLKNIMLSTIGDGDQHLTGARGKVLEIGCGTGRNLGYYNFVPAGEEKKVESYDSNECDLVSTLTLLDCSPEMIEVCKLKVVKMFPRNTRSKPTSSEVEGGDDSKPPTMQKHIRDRIFYHTSPVLVALRACPSNSFDTVVDTFGLCSYDDPGEVITEIRRVVKPISQGGRVLLLEHGKTPTPKKDDKSWFAQTLDKMLEDGKQKHFAQWGGCVWDKDIDNIVYDEGKLDVFERRNVHFGTGYLYRGGKL
jgi:methyltransferase OMS1